MFVFDLTLEKKNIPNINSWINPKFTGIGNLIIDKEFKINELNNPINFKSDFPEYNYDFNLEKPIQYGIKNHFELLKEKNGMLLEYDIETNNTDFLNMFELMLFMDDKLEKIDSSKHKIFNSFHVLEKDAILGINHFIKTNYPKIIWDWIATDYKNLFDIHPKFHILEKYKNNWIYGATRDGDITIPSNIIAMNNEINSTHQKPNKTKISPKDDISLITANYKMSKVYDNERNRLPIYMSQVIIVLKMLMIGGNAILKIGNLTQSMNINLLYLLSNCFNKLFIAKPDIDNNTTEMYIIAIDYKKNITELQIQRLLDILLYLKEVHDESPNIFIKSDIPNDFINKISDMLKKFQNYITFHNTTIENDMKYSVNIKVKKANEWIKKMEIKKINIGDKLL